MSKGLTKASELSLDGNILGYFIVSLGLRLGGSLHTRSHAVRTTGLSTEAFHLIHKALVVKHSLLGASSGLLLLLLLGLLLCLGPDFTGTS